MSNKLYEDLLSELSDKMILDYCDWSGVKFDLSNSILLKLKESISLDFANKVEANGYDEVTTFLSYMILNFHEFKRNVTNDESDATFFLSEIDEKILVVDGVKIGDKLRLVKADSVMIAEVIGFTEVEIPIVQYLEVDYLTDEIVDSDDLYRVGDILPYPYDDFSSKKM